jgi:hypothetical protein
MKETPIKWQVGVMILQNMYVLSRRSSLVSSDSTHAVQVKNILLSNGQ